MPMMLYAPSRQQKRIIVIRNFKRLAVIHRNQVSSAVRCGETSVFIEPLCARMISAGTRPLDRTLLFEPRVAHARAITKSTFRDGCKLSENFLRRLIRKGTAKAHFSRK